MELEQLSIMSLEKKSILWRPIKLQKRCYETIFIYTTLKSFTYVGIANRKLVQFTWTSIDLN